MEIFDILLHVDTYLAQLLDMFGNGTYVILFLIIFAETGLVVIPFLPGDSLLFTVGALAGSGMLDIWTVYFLLLLAAILGDSANYAIGKYLGPRVFAQENARLFKREYLAKTREFYGRHGGKTIIIARFLPIIRTFAPFVAGIGSMPYLTFLLYNIVGATIWVTSLLFAGFFLGGLTVVQENFEYFILGIIGLSLLPFAFEYFRHRRGPSVSSEVLNQATYEDIKETLRKEA
jgi:membrane-associated protein